jgi:hypothetical protein
VRRCGEEVRCRWVEEDVTRGGEEAGGLGGLGGEGGRGRGTEMQSALWLWASGKWHTCPGPQTTAPGHPEKADAPTHIPVHSVTNR